jgi:hypothetical protein
MADKDNMNYEPNPDDMGEKAKEQGRRIIEDIEVAGRDALDRAKELVAEGNVRRLIFMNAEEKVLLEIPLTAGVAAGAVVALVSWQIAAIATVVAFFAKIKIRVVREVEDDAPSSETTDTES